MSDPKPKMYVYSAAYQGRPALIVHTADEWMHEDLWRAFLDRLHNNAQDVGADQMWDGSRRDGLVWADESGDTDFRLPMQYPRSLSSDEALSKLIDFAPEFDWVLQETDTSQRAAWPSSGSVTVTWDEIAPTDDDPMSRYKWTMSVSPDIADDQVETMLAIASEHAFELLP